MSKDKPAASPEAGGSMTQILVEQMKNERRHFSGVLFMLFLVMSGIGALFVYNLLELISVRTETEQRRFATVGETAEAFTSVRNDLSAKSIDQNREQVSLIAARRALLEGETSGDLKVALDLARKHFLGEPLNMTSGQVVAANLKTAQGKAEHELLEAAIADWSFNNIKLDQPTLIKHGQALVSEDSDPAYRSFGHIILANGYFRQAELAENGWKWDGMCKEAVEQVDLAVQAGALTVADQYVASGDVEAAGLNLDYWRGQCLRKHGEPDKALVSFDRMLRVAAREEFPDENPFKFQAYHGKGTVVTAMLGYEGVTAETAAKTIAEAPDMLIYAGLLRRANGAIDSGAYGSTENISFLLLKEDRPDKYVRVLEHTGAIDEKMSLTWNLVARLAAARGLMTQEFPATSQQAEARPTDIRNRINVLIKSRGWPARDGELKSVTVASHDDLAKKYDREGLKEIVFTTHAKLAKRQLSSVNPEELAKLLGKDNTLYTEALEEAVACVKAKERCFEFKLDKWDSKITKGAVVGRAGEGVPAVAPAAATATPASN